MGRDDIPDEIVGEHRYAEHMREQLRALGLDAEVIGDPARPSVIAEARASQPADTLLIASHLDTSPPRRQRITPSSRRRARSSALRPSSSRISSEFSP